MPGSGPVFVAPTSISEAIAELADDGAMILGGGTASALLVKNDLVEPSKLVWLGKVPGLAGVDHRDGTLRIGAMTTLRQLARATEIPADAAVIADACAQVGNARVRAVATVGGAMVHGDPRQDLPPVLLALGATLRAAGPSAIRDIPVRSLYVDFMETCLARDEVVTDVLVPVAPGRRATYVRFTPNSEDDYPTVGIAAAITVDADGLVTDAAIALGGVGPTVLAVPAVTDALVGIPVADVDAVHLAQGAMASAKPSDDQRGSAAYKRAMVGVWTARAIEELVRSHTR